jgi:hypothetical protein
MVLSDGRNTLVVVINATPTSATQAVPKLAGASLTPVPSVDLRGARFSDGTFTVPPRSVTVFS